MTAAGKPDRWVTWLILLLTSGVFILDLLTFPDLSLWLLYFVPLSLAPWSGHRRLPVYLAMAITLLLTIGLFRSPSGIPGNLAAANRSLAMLTLWTVALLLAQRRRAEAALRDSSGQLQTLSRRLVEVQENECRYLARELHDEMEPILAGIKRNLQAAEQSAGVAAQPGLAECVALVEEAIEQVRRFAQELRPSVLEDFGLAAALKAEVDRQARAAQLIGHLTCELPQERLPAEVEAACYRIVQAALTNVIRHARAREFWVEVRQRAGQLHVTVRDDGVGFDVEAARQRAAAGGSMGLLGMFERAELVGGQIEIQSQPGQGTMIQVCIPLGGEVRNPVLTVHGSPSDS